MIRSGRTRVRHIVLQTEEDVSHLAILCDDDLVWLQAKSGGGRSACAITLPRETETLEILSIHQKPPEPPPSQPMAHPIPTYAQPHGTLAPGQTISVNKYTVQVERYLSQGEPHCLSRDRPFRNTTAYQLQPNYRRLCSRLSRTDFGTSLWDDTSCSQEDRRHDRFDVDGSEEGG